MGFNPKIAPIKAAILPLSKKEPLMETADKIFAELRKKWEVQYDESGSIVNATAAKTRSVRHFVLL